MEVLNADTNEVANVVPIRKKRGRKPTVYCDNKPIDPKYHVNYYHEVTKKRDFACPYCSKKFACNYNITRHLEQSNKACALKHFVTKHPEIASDSEIESPNDEWQRYYSIHNQPSVPDNPQINKWLDCMKDRPEPRSFDEWTEAGLLMVQMLLESQREKE
jgi:uncharacterized Zn-finger protein